MDINGRGERSSVRELMNRDELLENLVRSLGVLVKDRDQLLVY